MFKAIIEIQKNSRLKYEINKETKNLELDRVLHGSNVYPYNYGYIPQTKDQDGDPLDVVIISQESLLPGSICPIRILGALRMVDSGERDTKLIAVVEVDPRYSEFKDITSVPKGILNEIEDFFKNYKLLENKKVELGGFINREEALKIISSCKK